MAFITIESVHKSPQCNPLESSDEKWDPRDEELDLIGSMQSKSLSTGIMRRAARSIAQCQVDAVPVREIGVKRISFNREVTPKNVAKAVGRGALAGVEGVGHFLQKVVLHPIDTAQRVALAAADTLTVAVHGAMVGGIYDPDLPLSMQDRKQLVDEHTPQFVEATQERWIKRVRPLAELAVAFADGDTLQRIEMASQIGVEAACFSGTAHLVKNTCAAATAELDTMANTFSEAAKTTFLAPQPEAIPVPISSFATASRGRSLRPAGQFLNHERCDNAPLSIARDVESFENGTLVFPFDREIVTGKTVHHSTLLCTVPGAEGVCNIRWYKSKPNLLVWIDEVKRFSQPQARYAPSVHLTQKVERYLQHLGETAKVEKVRVQFYPIETGGFLPRIEKRKAWHAEGERLSFLHFRPMLEEAGLWEFDRYPTFSIQEFREMKPSEVRPLGSLVTFADEYDNFIAISTRPGNEAVFSVSTWANPTANGLNAILEFQQLRKGLAPDPREAMQAFEQFAKEKGIHPVKWQSNP